jgi:hypothetical protein
MIEPDELISTGVLFHVQRGRVWIGHAVAYRRPLKYSLLTQYLFMSLRDITRVKYVHLLRVSIQSPV